MRRHQGGQTHIQQPTLNPQYPSSNPLPGINVGLLSRALHVPLPLLVMSCVRHEDAQCALDLKDERDQPEEGDVKPDSPSVVGPASHLSRPSS